MANKVDNPWCIAQQKRGSFVSAFFRTIMLLLLQLLIFGTTIFLPSTVLAGRDEVVPSHNNDNDNDNNNDITHAINIAVLVADGFELLDAMGPYEALKEVQNKYYSNVDLKHRTWIDDGSGGSGIECNGGRLALNAVLASFGATSTVVSSSGVRVQPRFDLLSNDTTRFDLLVLGAGSVNESDAISMDYLRNHHGNGGSILTVCTGAEYVAALGLLEDTTATTNSLFLERFRTTYPTTRWISLAENTRQRFVVSTPQITTTAGITAGIDGILHRIQNWCGWEVAEATRECLEWPLPLESDRFANQVSTATAK